MSSGRYDAHLPVDGASVPVLIRHYARSKGYRLRYDAVKRVLLLSMPARGSAKAALRWAQTQEEWIARQLLSAPEKIMLIAGASLPVEGVERRILWDSAFPRTPALSEGELRVGGPQEQVGPRLLRWLRVRALGVLTQETQDIAAREKLRVVSVRVGDPCSRWGSCTSNGVIRYSWRLILAPPEVRLAIVAHEVAHLLHMDHSPAFHAAHARLLGYDPAPARGWLKQHGAALHCITA